LSCDLLVQPAILPGRRSIVQGVTGALSGTSELAALNHRATEAQRFTEKEERELEPQMNADERR